MLAGGKERSAMLAPDLQSRVIDHWLANGIFVASLYTCYFDFRAKKETKSELLKHDLLGN